ncbi:MAG TPA: hypothetical protein VHD81_09405 [Mycobacteriales bacterium]|nr:hypothetical protein [Mycobacteriales bacterium]
MKSAATITRRSVLGAGLLAIAACKHPSSPPVPHVDPDAAALAEARAMEVQLLSETTDPAERAAHLQHLAALGGTVPSPTATTTPVTEPVRVQLRGSADSLRTAAVAASNGMHAAVFASIAASHEVLLGD